MTKTKLKITGYEDSEDGKRTKFKTNLGWMSAFRTDMQGNELPLTKDLKQHTEEYINCEVVDSKTMNSKGLPYKNIRNFIEVAEVQEDELEFLEPVEKIKPLMKEVIETKPNLRKEFDKDPVGLACEIYAQRKCSMDEAITAVKEAQKAFS